MRLIYLANSRLPTEKAHGLQISKMCEAFARSGLDVLLLHPHRHQADRDLRDHNIFEYYGINPVFEVRTLPNWDVVSLERLLPGGLFAGLSIAHALGWGFYAAMYARKEGADLYCTRSVELAFWLTRLGLPVVLEMHVVPRRGRQVLVRQVARRRALRLVVTPTSFGREHLIKTGVPGNSIAVLPSGVDLSLFAQLPTTEECRRHLGLPLNRSIIGYVGRFQTLGMEKGIPELIQAMAFLTSLDGREPLLLCVGGPMTVVPMYLDLARRYGIPMHRLRFIEHVPACDVPYWIRACNVATLPLPWMEHYPYFSSSLKIFEYMAAGVPIVATRLPSVEEVLHHGKTAWLVEPGQAKALGDGIASLLRNPDIAAGMAQQARQEVARHTWALRANSILQLSTDSRSLEETETGGGEFL